jgi:hypothetical protein
MKRFIWLIFLPLIAFSEDATTPFYIEEGQEGYKPGNSLTQTLLNLASYAEDMFPCKGWADPNLCKNLAFRPNAWIQVAALPPRRKSQPIFANAMPDVTVLRTSNEIAMVMGTAPLSALKQLVQKPEVASENVPLEKEEPAVKVKSEPKKNSFFIPKRVELRHIEGPRNMTRFGTNYSTLEITFAPDFVPGHFLPMVDLRGHRFDNTKYAANAGLVARYIPDGNAPFCHILGGNLYYDYRQGSWGGFHQIGAGIEMLGKGWDLRANGYVPLSVTEHVRECVFDDYIGDYVIIKRKIEFVSYGYNAEFGYWAVQSDSFLLYGAASLYYLSGRSCQKELRGGRLRIRPQYKDYFAFEVSVSHDSIFQTVWQGQIILSIPLYLINAKKGKRFPCGLTERQVYQPVNRFEIMPMGQSCSWASNF